MAGTTLTLDICTTLNQSENADEEDDDTFAAMVATNGLANWLCPSTHPSQQEEEKMTSSPKPVSRIAAVATATATATATAGGAATDSPLEIATLTQLRKKETITRISPEKRALVEEIDTEEDDGEFDERAHWSRRSVRKKARSNRRKLAADKAQPSIAAFYKPQQEILPTAITSTMTTTAADLFSSAKNSEAAEEELVAFGTVSASLESIETFDNSEDCPMDTAKSDDLPISPSVHQSSTSVTETTTNGNRPKRQAVLRAEALQQQQKNTAIKKDGDDAIVFTPPLGKKIRGTKSSMGGNTTVTTGSVKKSTPVNVISLLDSTPPNTKPSSSSVGRKRKLDMEKKKLVTPSTNRVRKKESFFLSEQEKKQLQEIEAVTTFRDQLRQTREKDLAFFSGRTVNPFFHTFAEKKTRERSGNCSDESIEIIDDDNGTPERAKNKPRTGTKWTKAAPRFPSAQHVIAIKKLGTEELVVPKSDLLKLKMNHPEPICVDDDELTAYNCMGNTNHRVDVETTFSDLFWFQDQGTEIGKDTEAVVGSSSFLSDDEFIDDLVERYHCKEERVRDLMKSLLCARAKRKDKELNLSLVDKYLPVNASGIVGNKESLHFLSSWLSAWKSGGDERDRRSCFQSELFVFEEDDSEDDDVGDLCRLFVLEGESGSGKSAAVYACSEELGYEVIEINAAQNRSGKNVVDIAGEATQSTRVLHIGGPTDKTKKRKKFKKSKRKSLDGDAKPTASHLSLVLFEDIDLVFDEDKGFLNSVSSIAKHSKCPIVITCAQLPDAFPSNPARLRRTLHRPSTNEFSTWMMLVARLEQLPLSDGLVNSMAKFFKCDIRHSLHFLEANLHRLDQQPKLIPQWIWHPEAEKSLKKHQAQVDPIVVTKTTNNGAIETEMRQMIPGWTLWSQRSFDAMSSNLLHEMSEYNINKCEEEKSRQEKEADAALIADLAQVMDSVSVADMWMQDVQTLHLEPECVFQREKKCSMALDLRMASLSMLLAPDSVGATVLHSKSSQPMDCINRTLYASLADEERREKKRTFASIVPKFNLPLTSKGCCMSEERFALDYMPLVARILNSTANQQESRRKTSRRNHYLRDVLTDLSVIEELQKVNTYIQQPAQDQIVAASPSTSPLS